MRVSATSPITRRSFAAEIRSGSPSPVSTLAIPWTRRRPLTKELPGPRLEKREPVGGRGLGERLAGVAAGVRELDPLGDPHPGRSLSQWDAFEHMPISTESEGTTWLKNEPAAAAA
jgi:hypothetical protein